MLCSSFRSILLAVRTQLEWRRGCWLVLLLYSLWSVTFTSADEPPRVLGPSVRVMSYNIHHGQGMDGKIDLQRIADVILASEADLVALQEVDDKVNRSGRVDQVGELARLTGMHGLFGKQIDHGGGEYGQGILSRYPLTSAKVHLLPGKPEWEQRIAFSAEVLHPEQTLTFVTTHLNHLSEENRIEQVEKLNQLEMAWGHPIIIGGDFNSLPASPPMQFLEKKWTNATAGPSLLTFPADQPNRQIDFILFAGKDAFEVVKTEVIPESVASDHRPILVELRVNSKSQWK